MEKENINVQAEKGRLNEWDFAKGLLIIFVVWGHCCSYLSGNDYEKNLMTTYIRLFQMPLFILISGYFQKDITSLSDLWNHCKTCLLKIGVPYLTWSFISYIIYRGMKIIGGGVEHRILFLEIMGQITFLWFLGCILLCKFLFGIINFIKRKNKMVGMIWEILSFIVFWVLPGGYLDSFHFPFLWIFYLAGYYLRKININFIVQDRKAFWIFLVISFGIVIGGGLFKTEWTFYHMTNLTAGKEGALLLILIVRYLLYFFATLSALYWIFRLYVRIQDTNISMQIVGLGQKTQFLYVAHVVVLYHVVRSLIVEYTRGKGILVNVPVIRYYVAASAITVLTLVLLNKFYKMIERWKFGRIVLLGK